MSDAGILILDANVLASFDSAGWFDSFAFWTAEWEMVTAERVWDEYAVEQDIEAPPEWLTVETIDLNRIHAQRPDNSVGRTGVASVSSKL